MSRASTIAGTYGGYKVPGGKLVVVDTDVEEDRLTRMSVSGDLFLDPGDALTRITASLEGASASSNVKDLAAHMEAVLHEGGTLMGVTPETAGIAIRRTMGAAPSWGDIDFDAVYGPVADSMTDIVIGETPAEDMAADRRKPFTCLWERNGPQVVTGSFQPYQSEIQQDSVDHYGTTVPWRVTDDGAMFMEPDNHITYSLAIPTALMEGVNFEQVYPYLDQRVMEVLEKLGVKAKYVSFNDTVPETGKIDGAAQKCWANGYTVHHVTTAYDISAVKMNEVLRIGMGRIRGKNACSIVKRVGPMHSQTGLPREGTLKTFFDHFKEKYSTSVGTIIEANLEVVRKRCETKFARGGRMYRIP